MDSGIDVLLEVGLRDEHAGEIGAGERRNFADIFRGPGVHQHDDDRC